MICPPESCSDSSARGDAAHETLLKGQPSGIVHAVVAAHSHHLIQQALVQHAWHEACPNALYLHHTRVSSTLMGTGMCEPAH